MNNVLKQNGAKFGVILAILLFLPSIIGAFISIDFLLSNYTFIIVVMSVIVLGLITIAVAKKKFNGNITFKECFSTYFVMIVVGLLICASANFVLFNTIKKDSVAILKTKQIEMQENARKMITENTEIIDEEKEKYLTNINQNIERIQTENPYSLSSLFKGTITFIIIFSIFGLLLSMLLKTRKN